MRTRVLTVAGVLAAVGLSSCVGPRPDPLQHQSVAAVPGSPSRAVRRARQKWVEAFNAQDAYSFASMYCDDAQVVWAGKGESEGREAVRAALEAAVRTYGDAEFTIKEIEVAGDTAYELSSYTNTYRPAGRKPAMNTGWHLVIWKRGRDGAWRQYRAMVSSSL